MLQPNYNNEVEGCHFTIRGQDKENRWIQTVPPPDQAVMYSGRGQDKGTGRIPSATPHTDQLHIHEGHQKAMSNNIYNTEVLT